MLSARARPRPTGSPGKRSRGEGTPRGRPAAAKQLQPRSGKGRGGEGSAASSPARGARRSSRSVAMLRGVLQRGGDAISARAGVTAQGDGDRPPQRVRTAAAQAQQRAPREGPGDRGRPGGCAGAGRARDGGTWEQGRYRGRGRSHRQQDHTRTHCAALRSHAPRSRRPHGPISAQLVSHWLESRVGERREPSFCSLNLTKSASVGS